MKFISGPLGLTISVKVQPGACQSIVQGIEEEYLKVRLAAPPVEGRANEELIRLFSRLLDLPKSKILIRHGVTSRRKTLLLEGYREADFRRFLETLGKGKTKHSNGEFKSD